MRPRIKLALGYGLYASTLESKHSTGAQALIDGSDHNFRNIFIFCTDIVILSVGRDLPVLNRNGRNSQFTI